MPRASRCAALVLLALLPAIAALPAAAVPIFADDFDAEPGSGDGVSGGSGTEYTGFAKWSVSDGTVDLIAQGDFGGIDCAGGTGKCVDLDGGTGDAGILTSDGIFLDSGLYELRFALAGTASHFSGDPGASEPNIVDVALADLVSTSVTRELGDPYQTFAEPFEVGASRTVQISFANRGGDNFGALLDDVRLVQVPEPRSAVLLALGALALGMARRRRS